MVDSPRLSDLPVRSSQGVPHIDNSSHVLTVHLLGDDTHTLDAHVSRMRRFAASDVDVPIAFATLAQHDMQKLEIESIDGHRLDAAGNLLFHVQWRGFTVAEASFEPADQTTGCAEGDFR